MLRPLPGRAADRAAAALLLLHAILAWLARAPGVETMHDDARYLMLARALRMGTYRDIWQVGAPWHQLYPPGYPATLALWGLPFGDRYGAFVALNVLASVATLGLIYLTLRRIGLVTPALLVLVPLSVNTVLIERAGLVASEPLFIFWSTLALAALAVDTPSPRRLVVAGAAAIMATLTRTAGIALLVAIAADWLLARRWRAAAVLGAASALTVGAWLAWTVLAPQQQVGASYVADLLRNSEGEPTLLGLLGSRVYWAMERYFGAPMAAALTFPSWADTSLDGVLAGTLLVMVVPLGLLALHRVWRAVPLYVLSMGALLVLWAWKDERFLIPLAPFLIVGLIIGTWALVGRGRAGAVAAGVIALLLVTRGLPQSVDAAMYAQRCPHGGPEPAPHCLRPDQAGYFAALRIVRTLPANAVVLNAKAATLSYYTGRRTGPFHELVRVSDSAFVPLLREQQTGYVLLSHLLNLEVAFLLPRLEANCRAFAVVATPTPRTVLLRLRDPGEPGDASACGALDRYRHAATGASFG